MIFRPT